jgi:hypothetical protein
MCELYAAPPLRGRVQVDPTFKVGPTCWYLSQQPKTATGVYLAPDGSSSLRMR